MVVFTRGHHRCPDAGVPPTPLTWDVARHWEGEPVACAHDVALLTCSAGHTTRMSGDIHSVAADGAVSPSYVCTVAGCSFHDYVRLDGWGVPRL